jgi:hypothetical protein
MDEMQEDDLSEIKEKLMSYDREEIEFNEPHFTEQLARREGDREEVVKNLLSPEKLVYSYSEMGSYGDIVHCLHFKTSNTRTMRLPAIFDRRGRKNLYILTYIMRYRPWQNMIITRRRR